MIKKCAIATCPNTFQAIRPQAKYCGATCRKRAQRGTVVTRTESVTSSGKSPDQAVTSIAPDVDPPNSSLVMATRNELEAANVANTMLGQMALSIAAQMSRGETAGGMASLSKELSRVSAEALRAAVPLVADPIDELARRREEKLAAG